MLANGVKKANLTVLVANGTHRALCTRELMEMLDPRVFDNGIRVLNHDCRGDDLVYLCKTSRGSDIYINSLYLKADLKILTGLVESHFMAGVSGGRKSVCPGLIGESSTCVFHGPHLLDSPNARDLVLEGNPVHEESLEVAEAAGADFIVNVTLNSRLELTGVFAGGLRAAHESAVRHLSRYVLIPLERKYDLVVTHAGFVGVNHYQAAKAAVVATRPCETAPHGHDADPQTPFLGAQIQDCPSPAEDVGGERFTKLIFSKLGFHPDQWQVRCGQCSEAGWRHDLRCGSLSADDDLCPGCHALDYVREGYDTAARAKDRKAAVLAAADELRSLKAPAVDRGSARRPLGYWGECMPKSIICDMDGVIYRGHQLIPGADRFVERLRSGGHRFLFLTNNSKHTPRDLKRKLDQLGIDVPENHFYTSGMATARFLQQQKPYGSAFVIGDAGLTKCVV